MPPEVAALGILGCVVLILGAFVGAYVLGRDSERPRTEREADRADRAEAALEAARTQAAANAIGEASEHRAAVDVAGAVAAGDLERVRLSFRDDGSTPAAEQGDSAEQAGGGGDVSS